MDGPATPATNNEDEAFAVARRLGTATPLLGAVFAEEVACWHPDPPPPTVLLGFLGQAFADRFQDLAPEEQVQVALVVERAIRSGSKYVGTAVVTGFLEGAVHRAEANGTWSGVAAVLQPLSREAAQAYRSDPFFSRATTDGGSASP